MTDEIDAIIQELVSPVDPVAVEIHADMMEQMEPTPDYSLYNKGFIQVVSPHQVVGPYAVLNASYSLTSLHIDRNGWWHAGYDKMYQDLVDKIKYFRWCKRRNSNPNNKLLARHRQRRNK